MSIKRKIFSSSLERLKGESAYDALAKAKALEAEGKEIIHLEIGEPDFDTPKNIIDKGVWAMNNGYTHYTAAPGLMEVRKVIAEHVSATRNVPVLPEEVIIGPGAKPVIFDFISACVGEGDEVLIPNPAYPPYESLVNYMGGVSVPVPLIEEKGFRFEVENLEKLITSKTKILVINSPQNPTGGVLTQGDLEYIREIVLKHDLLVLSDEIYSENIYEGKHHSIYSLDGMKERTVLVDGASKTFAMTGWRIGYAVGPKEIIEKMSLILLNTVSCTATFTQIALVEALTNSSDSVKKMVKEFNVRRDVLVDGLNAIEGVKCQKPHGAFYVFPNFKSFGMTSKELFDYLLIEAGVCCSWGSAFGKYGEGYLRFSYANSVENIKKALKNMEKALKKLKKN
jgi:aspartate/methionine/tyrosine aminotransferase